MASTRIGVRLAATLECQLAGTLRFSSTSTAVTEGPALAAAGPSLVAVRSGGLAAALKTLAPRSPIPVDLQVHVNKRLPEPAA
jgi:hypothetical protein